ncbi:hypothetical protein D3C85_1412040 [compost metagenome]
MHLQRRVRVPAQGLAFPGTQGFPAFVIGEHLQLLRVVRRQGLGRDLLVLERQAQINGEVTALEPAHVGLHIGQAVGITDRPALVETEHPVGNTVG